MKKTLVAALGVSLVLLSPGIEPTRIFAKTFRAVSVPLRPLPLTVAPSKAPSLSLSGGLSLGRIPFPSLPVLVPAPAPATALASVLAPVSKRLRGPFAAVNGADEVKKQAPVRALLERVQSSASPKQSSNVRANAAFDGSKLRDAGIDSPVSIDGAGQGTDAKGLQQPKSWIPLARLVAFLVSSEKKDRDFLAEALRSGQGIESALQRSPGPIDYWRDLITDFSNTQFADRSRPIVELVTNGLDASKDSLNRQVHIKNSASETSVEDRGTGMNLETVLEKLLIPLLSGKEGLKTTGRFGVGFYSILQYLKTDEDSITLKTSDGQETFTVRIVKRNGEPVITFDREPGGQAGTKVSIHYDLPSAEIRETLDETLRFNTQGEIFLNGIRVNPPVKPESKLNLSGLSRIEGHGMTFLHGPQGDGMAYVTVNGVTIFSRKLEGKNVPGTFVVDFPVSTLLSVSRNMLLVDDFTRAMAKKATRLAGEQKHAFPFLNALAPLLSAIQGQNSSAKVEDNLERYLRSIANEAASSTERVLLPDLKEMHELAYPDAVFLHPSLYNGLLDKREPWTPYKDYRRGWFGSGNKLVLAPFEDSRKVYLLHGKTMILNIAHKPKTLIGKAALQAMMQTLNINGRIRIAWQTSDTLALLSAPLRWVVSGIVSLLPDFAARTVHRVRSWLSPNKERLSGYSKEEFAEFERTLRPIEKLILLLSTWMIVFKLAGMAGSMFALLLPFFFPAADMKMASLVIYMLVFLIVINRMSSFVEMRLGALLKALKPYTPSYSLLIAATMGSWFLSSVIITVDGLPWLTTLIPLLPTLLLGLFFISIRQALRDLLVAAIDSLSAATRSIPLLWQWRRLSPEIRRLLRGHLSLHPNSWALVTLLAALADRAPPDKFSAAVQRLHEEDFSGLRLAHARPLLTGNPKLAATILTDYDSAYFRIYANMAGVLAQKYPRLRWRGPSAKRFSEIWDKDLLHRDREFLENINENLDRFAADPKHEISRSLRPYLMHILGDTGSAKANFELDNEMPPESEARYTTFELSSLLSHYLGGGKSVQSREDLEAAVARPGPKLREKVARRALANSINFQSSNPYIFIRELVQNDLDEANARQAPDSDRVLTVETTVWDNKLRLSFEDKFGMDLRTLANFVLIPNMSSKRGDQKTIGQYGHGFLTILKETKKVLIKTGVGDGITHYVRLTPTINNGVVASVKVDWATTDETYKGTRFVWTKNSEAAILDAAHVKSQAITLAGLVDPKELRIEWDGAVLNKSKKLLGEAPSSQGELELYEFAQENTITHRGLYVKELESDYARYIPSLVRKILLEKGVILQLPAKLGLTRDRSEITEKTERLPEIGNALGRVALSAVIGKYISGEVEVDRLFPKNFVENAKAYKNSVPNFVLQDVAALGRGELISDASQYRDPSNLAMLLGSIPAIRLRFSSGVRGKVSLLWAFKAIEEGRIHWFQLPPKVSEMAVGKSLGRFLWRWGIVVGITAVGAYLLWIMVTTALSTGAAVPGVSMMSQAEVAQLVTQWWHFDTVVPDGSLRWKLLNTFGAAAGNPFAMAWAKALYYLSQPALIFGALPMLSIALGGWWAWKTFRAPPMRLPARVKKERDLYWAFADWTGRVATRMSVLAGKDAAIQSAFYTRAHGPLAAAAQGKPIIIWNLRNALIKLNPFHAFSRYIQGSRSRLTFNGITELLKITAHETDHTHERAGDWTEDQAQTLREADLLGNALRDQDRLNEITAQTRSMYGVRFGSALKLQGDLLDFPENELNNGSSQSAAAIWNLLKKRGASRTGELRRNRNGEYETVQHHPLAEIFKTTLSEASRRGVDPALRRVRFYDSPSPMDAHNGFFYSNDGVLYVNPQSLQALGINPKDAAAQLVLRHAAGSGRSKRERLSPEDLEEAGLIVGGKTKAKDLFTTAARWTKRSSTHAGGRTLFKYFYWAGLGYGILLLLAMKDVINSGLTPLMPLPDILSLSLLVLPLLWPFLARILEKLRDSFDLLESKGFTPDTSGINRMVKPLQDKLIEKTESSAAAANGAIAQTYSRAAAARPGRKPPISFLQIAFYSAAAWLEEYFFRYLMFQGLASWLAASMGWAAPGAFVFAALASAVLFAIFHFPNWKDLSLKQAIGLTLYYGIGALFLTGIYFIGGIWVATFVHMFYNVFVAGGKRQSLDPDSSSIPAKPILPPTLDRSDSLAAQPLPDEVRHVYAGDEAGFRQRAATLVEEITVNLPHGERSAILRALATGEFLGEDAAGMRFIDNESAQRLAARLIKFQDGDAKTFNKYFNSFIDELPPRFERQALGWTLRRLEGSLDSYFTDSHKADLPASMEKLRTAIEADVAASLGRPVRLEIYDGKSLLEREPQWGWPALVLEPNGRFRIRVAERVFYAMDQAHAQPWADELADLALTAAQSRGNFAYLEQNPESRLSQFIGAVGEGVDTGRGIFKHLKGWLIWGGIGTLIATRLLPLIKTAWLDPGLAGGQILANLHTFAGNFLLPGFAFTFVAVLLLDWGSKYWVNKTLVQVDHREDYKLRWKKITVGTGFFSFSFWIANVLHWIAPPRRLVSLLLPVFLILGGINLAANPVFGAILFAGAMGNLVEVAFRRGATDFIPLRIGIANPADFAILIGLLGPYLLALPTLPIGLVIGWAFWQLVKKTQRHFDHSTSK